MQKVFYGLVLITGIIAGCSDGKKAREGDVNDKRVRLEKLKKEQQNLNAEIEKLQKELALTDTTGRVAANPKLVAVAPVQPQDFTHYIDLQGKID
ncbi:MAG: efflux transporter periplasmic adaptor subunit, partial [Flavisolibacter sp.]|nr:efflux transporter periplasmic adaptor subunit [Flavisolibacter sp.]